MDTWTDPTSGKLWLRDFLPQALPDSRIMTFSYDAQIAFSGNMAGLEDFALDLLDRLGAVRSGEVCGIIPRAPQWITLPYVEQPTHNLHLP